MRSLRTCLCGFVLVAAARGAAAATVEALTCEYLVDPVGIDAVPPRLSWRLVSAARGERQTAYQVLAARSRETLAEDRGDLWDSGKVESDRSVHVEYAGAPLASAQGVKVVRAEGGTVVVAVGAGAYVFESRL